MTKHKLIVLALVLGFFSGVAIAVTSLYSNRPRSVLIEYSRNVDLPVYIHQGEDIDEHGIPQSYSGEPVYTLNGTEEISLRPGPYFAVSQDTSRYKRVQHNFIVTDEGRITIIIELQDEILNDMLDTERDDLRNALATQIVGYDADTFSIVEIQLYEFGEWAGIVFTKEPLEDYFRVVLSEVDDRWVIQTEPAILLSTQTYPEIPENILRDLNTFQYEGFGFRE